MEQVEIKTQSTYSLACVDTGEIPMAGHLYISVIPSYLQRGWIITNKEKSHIYFGLSVPFTKMALWPSEAVVDNFLPIPSLGFPSHTESLI